MSSKPSTRVELRAATAADADDILRLNAASEFETSPMNQQRLNMFMESAHQLLIASVRDESASSTQDAETVGFLIGFVDGSTYDSTNYAWFAGRLKQFFYIDRIVIDERMRGRGLGQQIYAQIKSMAKTSGLHWLAAEMNLEPPNPASLAFHQRQGFVEIGRQGAGGKIMSMQIASVMDVPGTGS